MANIELKHVELSENYRKKWNITKSLNDFKHLYVDGKKVSNTLYRVGGLSQKNEFYFTLLKQVESYYEDSITKIKKDKRHLDNCKCALDYDGNEILVVDGFQSLYLLGGHLVSISLFGSSRKILNIKTGEVYFENISEKTFDSKEYLFIENKYDNDKTKRGIWMINKFDGSKTLYK